MTETYRKIVVKFVFFYHHLQNKIKKNKKIMKLYRGMVGNRSCRTISVTKEDQGWGRRHGTTSSQ
jgi:hypothetical protein